MDFLDGDGSDGENVDDLDVTAENALLGSDDEDYSNFDDLANEDAVLKGDGDILELEYNEDEDCLNFEQTTEHSGILDGNTGSQTSENDNFDSTVENSLGSVDIEDDDEDESQAPRSRFTSERTTLPQSCGNSSQVGVGRPIQTLQYRKQRPGEPWQSGQHKFRQRFPHNNANNPRGAGMRHNRPMRPRFSNTQCQGMLFTNFDNPVRRGVQNVGNRGMQARHPRPPMKGNVVPQSAPMDRGNFRPVNNQMQHQQRNLNPRCFRNSAPSRPPRHFNNAPVVPNQIPPIIPPERFPVSQPPHSTHHSTPVQLQNPPFVPPPTQQPVILAPDNMLGAPRPPEFVPPNFNPMPAPNPQLQVQFGVGHPRLFHQTQPAPHFQQQQQQQFVPVPNQPFTQPPNAPMASLNAPWTPVVNNIQAPPAPQLHQFNGVCNWGNNPAPHPQPIQPQQPTFYPRAQDSFSVGIPASMPPQSSAPYLVPNPNSQHIGQVAHAAVGVESAVSKPGANNDWSNAPSTSYSSHSTESRRYDDGYHEKRRSYSPERRHDYDSYHYRSRDKERRRRDDYNDYDHYRKKEDHAYRSDKQPAKRRSDKSPSGGSPEKRMSKCPSPSKTAKSSENEELRKIREETTKKMGLGDDYIKKLEEQKKLREEILKKKAAARKKQTPDGEPSEAVTSSDSVSSTTPTPHSIYVNPKALQGDLSTLNVNLQNVNVDSSNLSNKNSTSTTESPSTHVSVNTNSNSQSDQQPKPKTILKIVKDKRGNVISRCKVLVVPKQQQDDQKAA